MKLLSVYKYSKNFDVCKAILNPEPLPGKDLLEPVAILKKKPVEKWRDKDIMPIMKLIAGQILIDGIGDNFDGANAFGSISEEFTNYTFSYSKIQALIDPVYVVVNLPSVGNLASAANIANNCPPVNSPHVPVVLVNSSNFIYSFASAGENVQHFIGWLQGTNSGVLAYLPVWLFQ